MDKAEQSGVGFSHLISVGNMVDLDFGEIMRMLDRDERCKRIGLYVEGIDDGKGLLEAIRFTSKPVIVFKTGKSELSKKAAFSHTGNLSGNYPLFTGLVKSVGAEVVPTIESLIYHHPCKKGILIITNAGGPASILTDLIIDAGKTLYTLEDQDSNALDQILPFNWSKANPVDIIGDALSQRYERTLTYAQNIDGVSIIFVIITPQLMTDVEEIALILAKKWNKVIVPVFLGATMIEGGAQICKQKKIPYFTSLQDAIAVL
jgi:acyl-CoA synthetase (NDP forming)